MLAEMTESEGKILYLLREVEKNLEEVGELLGDGGEEFNKAKYLVAYKGLHKKLQCQKRAIMGSLSKTVRRLVRDLYHLPKKRHIKHVLIEEWLSDTCEWFEGQGFSCREIRVGKGICPFYQFQIEGTHVGFLFQGEEALTFRIHAEESGTIVVNSFQIESIEHKDSFWFIVNQCLRFIRSATNGIDQADLISDISDLKQFIALEIQDIKLPENFS